MTRTHVKVLLVEDNPADLRLVRESLKAAELVKFELATVERLDAAVSLLRRQPHDVVLLDLSLPDSHGLETIARLSREVPLVPIVALSGNNDPASIQDAVKKGAEDYLIKGTYSTDLLERVIHYAIDRRRDREILAQARDSAIESARLRSEFLANMSHEIRTPLNGVIGMARLLSESRLDSDQHDMIEILRASSDALLRIVNDVLDYSKISAGKLTLEEVDFDLGTTVEAVFALFSEQVRRKGIELASYIDGDVRLMLRGDPVRLSQVLTNLVSNAVKFTSHGSVTARVGLVNEMNDEAVMRFTVRDTGIGIPLESQRYLFQAFSQADGSTTRRYGGTGLGLAISSQLVELMGGNIGVQSEAGGGSIFWFTATFGKQSTAAWAKARASARFEGARMLLADQSEVTAAMVREQTKVWGGRCDVVGSSAEALAGLKRAANAGTPYDVALIDLQLPDMDGLALGRAIRNDPTLSRTRVLAMYSLGERPDESQMRAAGIRGLLVRPIKQSQLLNVLSTTLAGVAQEAAAASLDNDRHSRPKNLSEISANVPQELLASTKLLLVEDNVINQQVQLRLLERLGYKADLVGNGREALEQLGEKAYDIVLMDCQMPEMDGYSATVEIRRREGTTRHTTVIGVTAHALAGDREQCLAAGMDDYIAKPIIAEDLAATLGKWVISPNDSSGEGAGSTVAAPAPAALAVLDRKVIAQLREYQRPGEADFAANLIAMYLADMGRRLEVIRAALERREVDLVRENAHALKGASGEIGARQVQATCQRLEIAAKEGALDQIRGLVHELGREATMLRAALETERAQSRP